MDQVFNSRNEKTGKWVNTEKAEGNKQKLMKENLKNRNGEFPWWPKGLRLQHFHCCGTGSILALGISTCYGCGKKEKERERTWNKCCISHLKNNNNEKQSAKSTESWYFQCMNKVDKDWRGESDWQEKRFARLKASRDNRNKTETITTGTVRTQNEKWVLWALDKMGCFLKVVTY